MNNSQKVLSQSGLQYFYNQISGRFAKVIDVTNLNSSLASHIDTVTAEISSLNSNISSLATWKTNSFGTTTINNSSKALFLGAVEYLKTIESGNATYDMIGYSSSTGRPYSLTDFFYTRADGKASIKLGSSSRSGDITLVKKNGGSVVLNAPSTGNSYVYFPAGGTSSAPAALALSSEVVAVSNSLDNAKKDVSALQTTVGGHTSSISSLTTTVNAIPNTYATKASLTTEINKILDGVNAELLDGLNEVIASLNGDKDFYSTMQSLLNEKASKAELSSTVGSAVDTINEALAGKASTSVVTTTANGIVPKSDAAKGTISSSTADWVFTNKNGTIGWYKLPANAFKDTVYTLPAAGSALGGVKTGGNVTISNGVITVNNDGHTHTVDNVTNLGNLLDEKITASDVTFTTDGSGNAITSITFNPTSKVFTLTKGATYNNYSLPVAKYNTLGGVKPAYTSTVAATLTTAAASNSTAITIATRGTSSSKYYGVEADKNGVLFVNVPWANNSVKQSPSATNGAFPILLRGTSAATSETTSAVSFATAITANPSTGTITATKFVGNGSGLTALSAANISAGTLPIGRGGTGATTAKAALTNLGVYYGSTAPSSPQEGMIWLQP